MKISRRDFLATGASCLYAPKILYGQGLSLTLDDSSPSSERQMVGVKLKCLVDVSDSINPREYRVQTDGLAMAMRSDVVKDAIFRQGGIAFSLTEFSFRPEKRIDWAILRTGDDVERMADTIQSLARNGDNQSSTALGKGINACIDDFNNTQIISTRCVIDVSGDGVDNDGSLPIEISNADFVRLQVRRCTDNGITCNGITLPTDAEPNLPMGASTLTEYFRQHVITPEGSTFINAYGGVEPIRPGFVITVADWSGFQEAMEQKLRLEIMGSLPPQRRVSYG